MKLRETVDSYLTYKRALGMRMESEGEMLQYFCRILGDCDLGKVSRDAVTDFILVRGVLTSTSKQKASVLRSFYRYVTGRGLVDIAPLPTIEPRYPPTRHPYIYTTEQIRDLLGATRQLDHPQLPLRGESARVLLLLLYGTGVRIGEALSLSLEDVDISNSLITVRDTKFFKSRHVPVGEKLNQNLAEYVEIRRRDLPTPSGESSAFFAKRTGCRWSVVWVEALFCRLRKSAGIGLDCAQDRQPRIHDLRHTMVQHCLLAWYRKGADVQRLLPQLATYLGHVDISSTQHYLSMTPELLEEANIRFQAYAQPETSNAQP
jgi:site-specific recombinase XerD